MFTGHPKGLFRLFFIEMWERLAFYTMVGVLLLYTIDTARGGLGMPKVVGNEIYGLYIAFVYFTPYIGGLLADRFLGYRRSVLIGGLFFALGFFLMGIYGQSYFVSGLVCLCVGNGFFKPNISVMVGNLYESGDPKRDTGFSIFYMGINIGAFIGALLAAQIQKEFGWLWIFWSAGIGMLVGICILLWSWKVLAKADRPPEKSPDDVSFGRIFGVILLPAFLVGIASYFIASNYLVGVIPFTPTVFAFLLGMLPILFFFVHLAVTAPPEEKPGLMALLPIYLAGATFFMVLHLNGSAMTTWAKENTDRNIAMVANFQEEAFPEYYKNAGEEIFRPHPSSLLVVGSEEVANMYGQKRMSAEALAQIAGKHGGQISVVTLGSEEEEAAENAGLSEAVRAERSLRRSRSCDIYESITVDRVVDHGVEEITITPAEGAEKLKTVAFMRRDGDQQYPLYLVSQSTNVMLYDGYKDKYGKEPSLMKAGEFVKVVNPVIFQSLNAMFVVMFTPLIIAFFTFLMNRGRPVSTAKKIFYGMLLTTLSLVVMGFAGILTEDGAIKGSWLWLFGFYAIITIGELCLSPMALSLVTKLSPKRLVGLTMGGWFIATAFGNNFSGFFGGLQAKMEPTSFFFFLAGIAGGVALIILLLLPKLDKAIKKYGA